MKENTLIVSKCCVEYLRNNLTEVFLCMCVHVTPHTPLTPQRQKTYESNCVCLPLNTILTDEQLADVLTGANLDLSLCILLLQLE